MRKFTLFLLGICGSQYLQSQICPATISAGGPTTFCQGGSVVLTANSGNSWTSKADFMGTARKYATGFSIGSKGYIGTGNDGAYKKDFWEYDPTTNAWTQKANFGGTARKGATSFSIGNKGYIGTGYNGKYQKDFWEYNPTTNVWTKKAEFKGAARTSAAGFSVGAKGYLGTGNDGKKKSKNDFYEYNPATNKWIKMADFAGAVRMGAVGFSIGSNGYIGTGSVFNGKDKDDDNEDEDNQNAADMLKDFWQYNPANNSWIKKADFGGGQRYYAVGFNIGNKGFIGTGSDVSSLKNDFWEYNAVSNTWSQQANFGGASRYGGTGFSVGCAGYIGTGNSGINMKDFWQYSAESGYLWSTGEITQSITVSTSGSYTVSVNNLATSTSVTSAPVVVTVNQPTASETTVEVCNSYLWNDSTYLLSGDYTYNTTNAAGCDSVAILHLTILSVSSTYTKTDAICFGSATGSVTITPTSGVAPYTYRIGTVGAFGPSNTFTGLRSGNYRVFIQDANGCAGISDQVMVGEQGIITATYNITDAICNATFTGAIEVNASGGTSPYTYRLGTSGAFVPSNTFNGLRAGSYRTYIEDANGCSINESVVVNQPIAVSATSSKTNVSCFGANDGSITVTGVGGTAPFSYRFGTVGGYSANNTFSNLKAGNYRIFVKDANDCGGISIVVTITQPSTPCVPVATFARSSKQDLSATNTAFEVSVSPNPSRSKFTLQVHAPKLDAITIRVLDVNGKAVYATKGQPEQAFRFGEMFAPGVYLVEVRQGNQVKTVKAVRN